MYHICKGYLITLHVVYTVAVVIAGAFILYQTMEAGDLSVDLVNRGVTLTEQSVIYAIRSVFLSVSLSVVLSLCPSLSLYFSVTISVFHPFPFFPFLSAHSPTPA